VLLTGVVVQSGGKGGAGERAAQLLLPRKVHRELQTGLVLVLLHERKRPLLFISFTNTLREMPATTTTPKPRQNTKPKGLKSVAISPTQRELQQKLAITPKTASFLLRLGYCNYRDLASASPNQIIAKLKALPNVPAKQAEWYRRPLRRMVWLGTQDEPEVQAAKTSHCSYWTIKGLAAKGIWQEGYDNLTGHEVEVRFAASSSLR
jgi:hypothetical protein